MVKVEATEVLPPGLTTVTLTGPALATRAVLTVALTLVEVPPGRVVRAVPPNMITEFGGR